MLTPTSSTDPTDPAGTMIAHLAEMTQRLLRTREVPHQAKVDDDDDFVWSDFEYLSEDSHKHDNQLDRVEERSDKGKMGEKGKGKQG